MVFRINKSPLVAVALLFAAYGNLRAQGVEGVRIAGAAYLGDLPTHVADARGLFAEHGLQATVSFSESGKANLARLRAGETDFALMALTPLVLDRIADADPGQPDDPVILASLLQSHELTAVIAAPDSGVEQPADLAGRRVTFARGTNTEFVWWLFEQLHGIDPTSVQTVSLSFSGAAEAVFTGQVDAAVLPEPWALQLEARYQQAGNNPPRRIDTRDLYAGRWIIVTTRRHVRERWAVCRNVLAAYRQAIEFIERNPDDAISVFAERPDGNHSLLVQRWEALDYDMNLDWALISSLQEQLHWGRGRGITAATGPIPVLELIEPGPLLETGSGVAQILQATARERVP